MPVRKRRNHQHMMEERSIVMLRDAIPPEWVMHEYKPDYGIDFVVEVFQYLADDPTVAETLGEMFFVQLKSVATTNIAIERVYKRFNVEKSPLSEDPNEFLDIEVIKFDIDVPELLTVKAMGVGLPVVLALACLDIERVFYVCLNDLIDKVLEPSSPEYAEQKTKRFSIPVKNELSRDELHLVYPRFLAKRSKLMSAFVRFEYQRNELAYGLRDAARTCDMALRFVDRLQSLDIWVGCDMWRLVPFYRAKIDDMGLLLKSESASVDEQLLQARVLWDGLVAMGHTFEELCREWNLPTHLAQFISYPDPPD